MKFSTTDLEITQNSFNPLDLINFDDIKINSKNGYPAFILRGPYIKTITKVPGVDFFNFNVREQEEKVSYWWAFLASLKCQTQILVHSVPIETKKYLNEVSMMVQNSPYLRDEQKEIILNRATWLNATLEYIKRDNNVTPFKKEYYVITSSTINFNGEGVEEVKKDLEEGTYELGNYKKYSERQWNNYENNFNNYYQDIMSLLIPSFDRDSKIEPLSTEEEIIWLFAELNNWIKREKIPEIKHLL